MGLIFETLFDVLWVGCVLKLKERGPWWLWIVVAASPLLLLALFVSLLWLAFG